MLCQHCARESYTRGWLFSELCLAHYEIELIRCHMDREGRPLTVETIRTEMRRVSDRYTFSFTPGQVPELLAQYQGGQRLAVVLPTD